LRKRQTLFVAVAFIDRIAVKSWTSRLPAVRQLTIFADKTIRLATHCDDHWGSAKLYHDADNFKSTDARRQVACVAPTRLSKGMEIIR
jgi:hypothetical protein